MIELWICGRASLLLQRHGDVLLRDGQASLHLCATARALSTLLLGGAPEGGGEGAARARSPGGRHAYAGVGKSTGVSLTRFSRLVNVISEIVINASTTCVGV